MLCGSLDGRGVWGRMDTCIFMAESLHCSPETITALLIDYTPIQNKKLKKKKSLWQYPPQMDDTERSDIIRSLQRLYCFSYSNKNKEYLSLICHLQRIFTLTVSYVCQEKLTYFVDETSTKCYLFYLHVLQRKLRLREAK